MKENNQKLTKNQQQTTLAQAAKINGIGLHTGTQSTLTMKPARADEGIYFVKNGVSVPALAEYVTETNRGVTLSRNGQDCRTVEHLLSALKGLQVDNALLELEGEEVPALDGSAIGFVHALQKAGVTEIPGSACAVWRYEEKKSFLFQHRQSNYRLLKSPHLSLDVSLSFPNTAIGVQETSFILNGDENYAAEIAQARTFCLEEEIEALRQAGLALGGSLENAIVVGKTTIQSNRPLIYKDEFARHKLLDLLGDLSLLGSGIFLFNVAAFAPGHGSNFEFVKQLRKILRKGEPYAGCANGSDNKSNART